MRVKRIEEWLPGCLKHWLVIMEAETVVILVFNTDNDKLRLFSGMIRGDAVVSEQMLPIEGVVPDLLHQGDLTKAIIAPAVSDFEKQYAKSDFACCLLCPRIDNGDGPCTYSDPIGVAYVFEKINGQQFCDGNLCDLEMLAINTATALKDHLDAHNLSLP